MRARTKLALALVLLPALACAQAFAADPHFISVKVKDGGKLCLVQKKETNCDDVPKLLDLALKASPGSGVIVSPEGCGTAAIALASSVAERLKAAGFRGVFVVGFESLPDGKCAF